MPTAGRAAGARTRARAAAEEEENDSDLDDLDDLIDREDDADEADEDTARTLSGYAVGKEFMLFRKLTEPDEEEDVPARWVIAKSTDAGTKADSRVHRYDREIGFRLGDAETREMQATATVAQEWHNRRQEIVKFKSHYRRVEHQAMFERWCLARAPDSPYTAWLKDLQAAVADRVENDAEVESLPFKPPAIHLVLTYITHLRKDPEKASGERSEPDHKGGPIKNAVSAISATCTEFGAPKLMDQDPIRDRVRLFLHTDGYESSRAFDMEADMINLFTHVWTLRWSKLKQIECWAMLLISIIIFGRASCVTAFCPLFQDIELPAAPIQWDADGLPKYIILGLRDWKWRTPANKCRCARDRKCTCEKLYKMTVHRNSLDQRFCPVFWLLTWFHYSGIEDIEHGPIFQDLKRGGPQDEGKGQVTGEALKEHQWTTMTGALFQKAGLYTPAQYKMVTDEHGRQVRAKGSDGKPIVTQKARGVTNQGIRRSAAQWAGRSGCTQILDLANNGRWKTLETISTYMGQGAKKRKACEAEHGADPIFKTWVWKPVAVAGISTRNEL